ncbi:hypothetical protein D9M70_408250 [compost metagenome]
MAEHHARQGLYLDVMHRVPLDLGKAADLRLREADIVQRLRGKAGDAGFDLRRREPEAVR